MTHAARIAAAVAGVAIGIAASLIGGHLASVVVTTVVVAAAAEVWLARRWASALRVVRHDGDLEVAIDDLVVVEVDVVTDGPSVPFAYVDDVLDVPFDSGGTWRAWADVSRRHPLRLAYSFEATRRGLYRVGPTLIETSGPLGLSRCTRIDAAAQFVTVMPPIIDLTAPLAGERPVHSRPRRMALLEDASRLLGVREYRPGDELRRVHWRATARTGTLQVRLFERVALSGVTFALELSTDAWRRVRSAHHDAGGTTERTQDETVDLDGIDLAVTCVISVAALVLDAGLSAGLLSNGIDAGDRLGAPPPGTHRAAVDAMRAIIDERGATRGPAFVVPAARSDEQRRALHVACARITHQDGPSLERTLIDEVGRLPGDHVLALVTPRLDERASATLAAASAVGLDAVVFWVTERPRPDQLRAIADAGVPVFAVRSLDDLRDLAGVQL